MVPGIHPGLPLATPGRHPVNDHMSQIVVTANGKQGVKEADTLRAPEASSRPRGSTVEQRLEALMETVRTWNWRPSSPNGHSAEEVAGAREALTSSTTATFLPVSAPANDNGEDPEPVVAADTSSAPGSPDSGPALLAPMPRHARTEPESVVAFADNPEDAKSSTAAPVPLPQRIPAQVPLEPTNDTAFWYPIQPATLPSSDETKAEAAPPSHRLERLSRIKVFSLYVASAAAVLLVIGAIRFFA
jgi:hypothetical protein